MAQEEIAEFYDEFSDFQQKIAYNERHFLMLDKLIELGLTSDSKILELGCGIGIISSLILRVVQKGKLVAVDISPKSIEIARANNAKENAEFHVGDVTAFEPPETGFDFVTLFDVLEHVPVDGHQKLFEAVSGYLADDGKLIVNIPNPAYLQFIHDNYPERLQIIDQPLSIPRVIEEADNAGFKLRFFENYDLWRRYESVFMWFNKEDAFEEIETDPPTQSIKRRFQNKFEFYW